MNICLCNIICFLWIQRSPEQTSTPVSYLLRENMITDGGAAHQFISVAPCLLCAFVVRLTQFPQRVSIWILGFIMRNSEICFLVSTTLLWVHAISVFEVILKTASRLGLLSSSSIISFVFIYFLFYFVLVLFFPKWKAFKLFLPVSMTKALVNGRASLKALYRLMQQSSFWTMLLSNKSWRESLIPQRNLG